LQTQLTLKSVGCLDLGIFKIYDALECLNIFKEIKDEPTIIWLIFEALHYPIVAAINFY
jgi:hypothetical protein